MTATVIVQDAERNNIGQLDELTQLDLIPRYNDVGSWAVALPRNELGVELAQPGARILIEGYGDDPISGPMRMVEREWDEAGERYVISGLTDEVHLFDRLVYPCEPVGVSGTAFSGDDYDVRTGKAETVMKGFVRANATALSGAWVAGRAVHGLTIAIDSARGSSVTGRGRFQVLGEMLQQLALASTSKLGFRVSNLEFDVYEPNDLTQEAMFSVEIGNLAGFRHVKTAPEATHFVVAAGGQGVNRLFRLGGDDTAATTWHRRVEAFRDRRDTTEDAELVQQLAEEIADKAEKNEVTMRPINTTDLAFGRDYFLGDLISVEGVAAVLSQVEITLNGDGETITPSVNSTATAAASSILRIFDAVRRQNRRISGLERAL